MPDINQLDQCNGVAYCRATWEAMRAEKDKAHAALHVEQVRCDAWVARSIRNGDRLAEVIENNHLGPWRCELTGLVWIGDISNHHNEQPFCGGPHLKTDLIEYWKLITGSPNV
jgi:hypothetical protein